MRIFERGSIFCSAGIDGQINGCLINIRSGQLHNKTIDLLHTDSESLQYIEIIPFKVQVCHTMPQRARFWYARVIDSTLLFNATLSVTQACSDKDLNQLVTWFVNCHVLIIIDSLDCRMPPSGKGVDILNIIEQEFYGVGYSYNIINYSLYCFSWFHWLVIESIKKVFLLFIQVGNIFKVAMLQIIVN